ncbi:MAG: hypothetical protein WB789_00260 [Thermoplasmata archaeon]
MALFVLIATHSSDQCPTANEKTRKLFGADPAPIMALAQKLGVKPVVGPLVSTEHRTFVVMEAQKVEAVRDFVMQSGLIQWNSVEIINVITQEEAIKEIAALTPIY